jgi:hypothetical protein
VSEARLSWESLIETYRTLVRRISATALDFYALLKEVNEEDIVAKNGYNQEIFSTLRDRGDSELLSIAFFGAFSSGKSFLISGLNKRIDVFEHQGRDQFAPLLPASPRHTSSCPVAIEPLPLGHKEDTFSVSFEGAEGWEVKKPPTLAIIQAYVTDLPNAKAQRLTNKDRTRTVLKARLRLSSPPLKARLYDLPGFGAIGFNYEGVIRSFVQGADCIAYVAWAVRPLDEKDLDLLRDIYLHHKATGKPVFFILTQIDLSWDIDSTSGKIKWEDVLEANNEFLSSTFTGPDGRPDGAFIGGGFIPVSPALEAKGLSLPIQQPSAAKRFLADSRMHILRERFEEYLRNTSGPMHLAELASECQRLLQRLGQDITSRIASECTPGEDVRRAIKGYRAQRGVLIEGKRKLEEELSDLGHSAITRAFAGSDPDNLARLLTERVADRINKDDVLSAGVVHEIETEKARVVREWICAGSKALIPRWTAAWDSFVKQANERVEKLVSEAVIAQYEALSEEEAETDLSDAEQPSIRVGNETEQRERAAKDAIEVMSKTWKLLTFMGTVGATTGIASSVPASVAAIPILGSLGPVGWAFLAAASVGVAYSRWKLHQHRNERREAMLNDLPDYAHRAVSSYRVQADEIIRGRIGLLLEAVDNQVERLNNSIESLEQRLLTGEYLDRERRLERLSRLERQCVEIDGEINSFYREAAKLQPAVTDLVDNPQGKQGLI